MTDHENEAHKEATMFDTEEELTDLCKTLATGEAEGLADDSFHPKFVWMDKENGPRLFMFPDMPDGLEDRDSALGAIGWALQALSSSQRSEYLAFVSDSYQAKSMTKHNGDRWGPGEMGDAFRNKTVDADLVFEAFTLAITDRNGWHSMVAVPYYRDGAGGVLFEWDDITTLLEASADGRAGGVFPMMMGQAMTTPHLLDASEELREAADAFGFSDAKRDMHMLCAAVKTVMMQTGFPCALPAWTEEEKDTLTDSFAGETAFNAMPVEPE